MPGSTLSRPHRTEPGDIDIFPRDRAVVLDFPGAGQAASQFSTVHRQRQVGRAGQVHVSASVKTKPASWMSLAPATDNSSSP